LRFELTTVVFLQFQTPALALSAKNVRCVNLTRNAGPCAAANKCARWSTHPCAVLTAAHTATAAAWRWKRVWNRKKSPSCSTGNVAKVIGQLPVVENKQLSNRNLYVIFCSWIEYWVCSFVGCVFVCVFLCFLYWLHLLFIFFQSVHPFFNSIH
jgi:hypothetical protein